eukprot:3259101-Pyramimonas_sp.AAC.1
MVRYRVWGRVHLCAHASVNCRSPPAVLVAMRAPSVCIDVLVDHAPRSRRDRADISAWWDAIERRIAC